MHRSLGLGLAFALVAATGGCSEPGAAAGAGPNAEAAAAAAADAPAGDAAGAEARPRGAKPVDEATKRALLEALTPGQPMPPPRAPEGYPGDGKPFPLTIEVVSGATGELLRYNMCTGGVDYFHPKIRGHIDTGKWEQDPDHARMSIERFVPAQWEFRTSYSSGTPHYTFTCDVYEQPAGGVLRIVVPQVTLTGQLLDPTGAPAPDTAIEVIGDITGVESLKAVGVVHVKVMTTAHTGPDGRFEITGLIPGRYLLNFEGYRRIATDRWERARTIQIVAVGERGAVLIVDPRTDRVIQNRKRGGQ